MSLHVLKRKANEKTKLIKQNQYASARNMPFSLNMTNRGVVRSVPVKGQVGMSGCCPPSNSVRKPSRSQSYFNFHRRSTSGQGSLASRVVHPKAPGKYNSTNQMMTYKRTPEFSQSDFVKNKKSEALRCDFKGDRCDTKNKPTGSSCLPKYVEPNCYNNCGKQSKYTKDLRYISSSDHIQKKLANRKFTGKYEETLMNANNCTVIE